MNTSKVLYGYDGYDVISFITIILEKNSKYSIKFNGDNSQIVITRQNDPNEDK